VVSRHERSRSVRLGRSGSIRNITSEPATSLSWWDQIWPKKTFGGLGCRVRHGAPADAGRPPCDVCHEPSIRSIGGTQVETFERAAAEALILGRSHPTSRSTARIGLRIRRAEGRNHLHSLMRHPGRFADALLDRTPAASAPRARSTSNLATGRSCGIDHGWPRRSRHALLWGIGRGTRGRANSAAPARQIAVAPLPNGCRVLARPAVKGAELLEALA
jgi:hypothetical protein